MPKSTRPLCLYHKNCLDGRGAAAVVARREPDAEFLPIQYGQKRPVVTGRKVYIVDFGLPAEEMRAIYAEAAEVIWLDHHATHAETQRRLGWGVVDTSECGTSLTWKHLFPGETPPPVVAYIKDKDLWQWKLPDSRAIAAGLELAFPKDAFTGLLEVDLAKMAELGRPALAALAERVTEMARSGTVIADAFGIAGVRALAVPARSDLNDLGEHICLPPEQGGLGYDIAVIYYQKLPKVWVHSLRSSRIDCAAIAAARGGGGHPSAACFMAPEPLVPKT